MNVLSMDVFGKLHDEGAISSFLTSKTTLSGYESPAEELDYWPGRRASTTPLHAAISTLTSGLLEGSLVGGMGENARPRRRIRTVRGGRMSFIARMNSLLT